MSSWLAQVDPFVVNLFSEKATRGNKCRLEYDRDRRASFEFIKKDVDLFDGRQTAKSVVSKTQIVCPSQCFQGSHISAAYDKGYPPVLQLPRLMVMKW